jgi:hypothetical protein
LSHKSADKAIDLLKSLNNPKHQTKSNLECNSKSNLECNSKSNLECNSKSNLECNSKSNLECNSKSNLELHSKLGVCVYKDNGMIYVKYEKEHPNQIYFNPNTSSEIIDIIHNHLNVCYKFDNGRYYGDVDKILNDVKNIIKYPNGYYVDISSGLAIIHIIIINKFYELVNIDKMEYTRNEIIVDVEGNTKNINKSDILDFANSAIDNYAKMMFYKADTGVITSDINFGNGDQEYLLVSYKICFC